MKKKFDRVYQFKITLRDTKLPIWRRIQVPETYTFYDLHVAIQNAMGWYDYHLHEFSVLNPLTGMNVEIGFTADYVYDFGDFWQHKILLEEIIPGDPKIKYPVCIKGKRSCPPEEVRFDDPAKRLKMAFE